jgi:endoglucanase
VERWFTGCLAAAAAAATLLSASAAEASTPTRFYVPLPSSGAAQQAAGLVKGHDAVDALRIGAMESYPRAVWLNGGTPQDAQKQVQQTMFGAALQRATAVFVVYDIPDRDCSGYSSGGAAGLQAYEAYIDGVAAGLGHGSAWVILEPDSLGLLPQANCGSTMFTDADRFAELNYAVDTLGAAGAHVYLDATHPDWLGVPDAASRLLQAGVSHAAGFFLNVSNYQYTVNSVMYGTWISDCIATQLVNCANKYWNGPTYNAALSPYGEWSNTSTTPTLNTGYINAQLAGVTPATHFVIDTSRNGLGPWDPVAAGFSDKGTGQDWCNPPNRGLGPRPTANTGNTIVDAYLWIKTPGQSDGQCTRGTAGPTDPARGVVDPVAGEWFPQQALELARLARPALVPFLP